ncbi:hypothetical protein [Chryseobacterium sp. Mn2064]|uniref:hypothetical protein n=1 Tax=Chryseobacterium sp. Mn2064 TaxID=3395263 RepID=UPI003BBA9ED8
MFRNFNYLTFFLLCFSLFSCQNSEKTDEIGKELILENLPVLLDNLDYFNTNDTPLSVGIYQYVGEIKSDQKIVLKNFQNRFNLNNEKIFNGQIKIRKIPVKIGNYSLFLDKDNAFQKRTDVINISFVNPIISKNNQYACIEVVKSLGSGAKFEIYYFKQKNGKWIFVEKEVIALG